MTVVDNNTGFLKMDLGRIIIGLSELGNLDIEDFDTNFSISKTIANLTVFEKAYSKTIQSLQKRHIKIDEKGQLANENGSYIFKSVKDREDYLDAFDKISEEPVNCDVWRLKLSELRKIKGIKGTMMAKFHELIIDDTAPMSSPNK